jgi:hypothetical protein
VALSNQKLALVHVAKAQLAIVDEDYRALLQRVASVHSARDLDEAGLDRVMAEFERLGFQKPRSRIKGSMREGMATPAQIGRIRSLWKSYSGNDDELRLGHWLEKHFHVSSLRFLQGWRAGKVIAILEGRMVPYAKAKRAERG